MLLGVGTLANHDFPSGSPLQPGGELLGFDLYEFDNQLPPDYTPNAPDCAPISIIGLGCSFFCCDIDGELPKRLGIKLNSNGLYPDAPDALRASELINSEQLGEPGRYLPLALVQYNTFS